MLQRISLLMSVSFLYKSSRCSPSPTLKDISLLYPHKITAPGSVKTPKDRVNPAPSSTTLTPPDFQSLSRVASCLPRLLSFCIFYAPQWIYESLSSWRWIGLTWSPPFVVAFSSRRSFHQFSSGVSFFFSSPLPSRVNQFCTFETWRAPPATPFYKSHYHLLASPTARQVSINSPFVSPQGRDFWLQGSSGWGGFYPRTLSLPPPFRHHPCVAVTGLRLLRCRERRNNSKVLLAWPLKY